MAQETNSAKAKGLKLVLRGESVEVEHRPAADFEPESLEGVAPEILAVLGNKELVRVHQLNLDQMEEYLFCYQNEARAIELVCDKPEGWAATLLPESHATLVQKGQGVNRPLFKEWFDRRMARLKMLTGIEETPSGSTSSSPSSSSAQASAAAS